MTTGCVPDGYAAVMDSPRVLSWAEVMIFAASDARRIEARRAMAVEQEAGCVCRYNAEGLRIAVSDECRQHRDPKLNNCEDEPCPGCWTCWGQFWPA